MSLGMSLSDLLTHSVWTTYRFFSAQQTFSLSNNNRLYWVIMEGQRSSFLSASSGVLQVSALGQTLFSVYVNQWHWLMKIWSLNKVFYCKWCFFVYAPVNRIRCLLFKERLMYPWKVGGAVENEKYQAVNVEGGHNKVDNCEYKIDGKRIASAMSIKYLCVCATIRYFFLGPACSLNCFCC